MTIDKRALREVAERATKGEWSVQFGDEIYSTDGVENQQIAMVFSINDESDAEFIAAANPATMLALLDENIQLQRGKDAMEAVALALRDDMQDAREKLEAAGRLIAELDKRLIEYAGIATREARRVAELEARAVYPAILDVMGERQRQQSVEGWTPEHDDEHCSGELAMAAVCYINDTGAVNRNGGKPWGWPWDASWWKPDTRRRNLVKAGALILAEIERIDRAAGIKVKR